MKDEMNYEIKRVIRLSGKDESINSILLIRHLTITFVVFTHLIRANVSNSEMLISRE